MQLIFKPFILNILLVTSMALLLSQLSGYFMKDYPSKFIPSQEIKKDKNFDILSSIPIQERVVVRKVVKKKQKVLRSFLLKEFSISGIILDGDNSMVIIRDTNSGKFMQVGDLHKGYKLSKIYVQKVLFIKNGNRYFAFLTPEGEKEFKSEVFSSPIIKNSSTKREELTGTTSRSMFSEIKYKKGKYFIPRDLLMEYTTLNRIFSGISIQSYSIKDKIKFKINYISPNSVFIKMGLKKYDYIIKINNTKIKSVTEPIKYFQNLENIKTLSLTVKRGNKIKELKYEIY